MHVAVVFGTRPEAIKLAPVIRVLKADPTVQVTVIVTGQHREMLDQVLDLFQITPDFDLEVMQAGQSLGATTSRIIGALDELLPSVKPDWTVVQGDTTTTVAGAWVSFQSGIPVAHVEAGLRTRSRKLPFPEEINRRMTSLLADLHFAATALASENLQKSGVPPSQIVVTGNTVVDALAWATGQLVTSRRTPPSGPGRRIVATCHRRENFGRGAEDVAQALLTLALRNPADEFVFVEHLNPRAHLAARRVLEGTPNVRLLPPLDYVSFLELLMSATIVVSDSGGLQEEAPALGKPLVILRDHTERPEAVIAGAAVLTGTDPVRIVNAVERLLVDRDYFDAMASPREIFGDGYAAGRIAAALRVHFAAASAGLAV